MLFRSQYIGLLEEAEVQISRDGTGRALDTVFTERLWRTAKYEEVYLSSNLRLTAFDSTINNKGSRSTLDMPARLS